MWIWSLHLFLWKDQHICIVVVYVDDILIMGNNEKMVYKTKVVLKSAFEMKDLGSWRYFLGMEVIMTSQGLFLNQKKYTQELLEETGMSKANLAKTPMERNLELSRDEGEPMPEKNNFQRLIGKLIYLIATRPDITYAVNIFSQFMHTLGKIHVEVAHRILWYLSGSSEIVKKFGQTQMSTGLETSIIGNLQLDIVAL